MPATSGNNRCSSIKRCKRCCIGVAAWLLFGLLADGGSVAADPPAVQRLPPIFDPPPSEIVLSQFSEGQSSGGLAQPGSVMIQFPRTQSSGGAGSVVPNPRIPAPPGLRISQKPELLSPPPSRLESLPVPGAPFAATPRPTPEVAREFNRYVERKIDPQETLDLVLNRPRVLVLSEPPKRVQVPDETVATYTVLSDREIAVVGKEVGSTVLNLWFADPNLPGSQRVLSYLVRVIPDPEAKQRQERVYDALAAEINKHFPDSHVILSLVGDKLVVRGEAKDAIEATQILMVIRASGPGNQQQQQGGQQVIGTQNIPVGAGGMFPQNQASMDDELIANQMGIDAPGAPGVNSFVLRGSNNIINLLRVPGEQQVMLKVTIAEVNRAAARSIGMNFEVISKAGTVVFANFTGGLLGGTAATGAIGGGNLPAALDNGQIPLAIQALRTLSLARSLAEPNLVTVSGRPAFFHAGSSFAVPQAITSTVGSTVGQGVTYIPVGAQLTFTPYVVDRDRVRLQVQSSLSTPSTATVSVVGTAVPQNVDQRQFMTTVELREGQTLAVAGLLQNTFGSSANRVPFFGDLPFIGPLTGFSSTTSTEQEVVVLITPQLVHPMEHNQVPPLPGADVFEPGDLEFFVLNRLESRRAQDFRASARTDWARLVRYEHCQDVYILGPHGHGN